MCKIMTVSFDRKTWAVIGREVKDSDETLDRNEILEFLADRYIDKYGEE